MSKAYQPEFKPLLSVLNSSQKPIPQSLEILIQKFEATAIEFQNVTAKEVGIWLPILEQTDAAIGAWLSKELKKHGLEPPSEDNADNDRLKLLRLRAKAINLRTKQSA